MALSTGSTDMLIFTKGRLDKISCHICAGDAPSEHPILTKFKFVYVVFS